LPDYNLEAIKQGPDALVNIGERYCKNDECTFRMKGLAAQMPYAIDIVVPKHLVSYGYYPMFVSDIPKFLKDMKWQNSVKPAPGRVGVFFASSGLPKGKYKADYWIRMADTAEQVAEQCPSQVQMNKADIKLAH
jgi:hypothetical protein